MKRKALTAVLFALLAFFSISGCEKKGNDPGIIAVTPTQMIAVPSAGGTDSQSDRAQDGKGGAEGGKNENSPTDGGVNTADPATGKPGPTGQPEVVPEASPTPAGNTEDDTKNTDSEGGNEPTSTQEPDNPEKEDPEEDDSDSSDFTEYWEGSFLVWLPKFAKGSFVGFDSDETHDYLTLDNVTANAVEKYIKTLTKNGFTVNTAFEDYDSASVLNIEDVSDYADSENRRFCYSADNDDGWSVRLDYTPSEKRFIIGSGYNIAETTDVYGQLREETSLGLLPEFTYGTFDSSKQEGDMCYAVFSNVTGKYRKYIELLKKAGFTEEVDEGDIDGIVWYNASDLQGYCCEFIYTDEVARIGCGLPKN